MRIGLGKAFDRNEEVSGFGPKPIHQPAALGQHITEAAPVGYIIDKFFGHLVVAETQDTAGGLLVEVSPLKELYCPGNVGAGGGNIEAQIVDQVVQIDHLSRIGDTDIGPEQHLRGILRPLTTEGVAVTAMDHTAVTAQHLVYILMNLFSIQGIKKDRLLAVVGTNSPQVVADIVKKRSAHPSQDADNFGLLQVVPYLDVPFDHPLRVLYRQSTGSSGHHSLKVFRAPDSPGSATSGRILDPAARAGKAHHFLPRGTDAFHFYIRAQIISEFALGLVTGEAPVWRRIPDLDLAILQVEIGRGIRLAQDDQAIESGKTHLRAEKAPDVGIPQDTGLRRLAGDAVPPGVRGDGPGQKSGSQNQHVVRR
ncbi:MAG: hypothetical protein DDT24_00634 [Chloroflexi bacterium]|nr:hypothetical protein [Chloroflexota bacterium]